MLPELVGMCRQTVLVATRTGVDGFGEPTYGADATRRARVVGRLRTVTNAQGQQVVSSHQVYLADAAPVGPHDRVTLSTGDVNSTETGARQPPILAVGLYPDDANRHHLTVYLQ